MLGSQCHWRSRVINFLPAFRESIKGKHFLSPSFILFIRNYFPITPFFITKRSTSMIWVPLIRTSVVTLIINICFSYGFSQKKIKKHVISIPSAWFRAMHLLFPFVHLSGICFSSERKTKSETKNDEDCSTWTTWVIKSKNK